jgi:hypothetical protein
VFWQLVSIGGTARLGLSTVTESESPLNTSNLEPVVSDTTVWALFTAMLVNEPEEKFMTSTAPRKANPLTLAVGTAAYAIGFAVGITRLVVGPGTRTLPMLVSLAVSTAYTVLVSGSKAARMLLVGETTISPGEVPARSGETLGKVSFTPLMKTSEPKLNEAVTP